jgi:phenylalanine-4-hydroxylase
MTATMATTPAYTDQDHATWAQLYAEQMRHVPEYACAAFRRGLPLLGLDPLRVPDKGAVGARVYALSGWKLGDAQNEYLGATEWFEHIAERRFPVTNYIRKPDELPFTPLPDLFHEYFGHLAFFTDRRFGDIAQAFGPLYLRADERQRLEIARLWWFTIEFGLVREGSGLRALGAGLLSSPAELRKAFAPDTPRLPFDVRRAAEMPSAAYGLHDTYFILDDVEHIDAVLQKYTEQEQL